MDKMCEFCIYAEWTDDDGEYHVERCKLGCTPVKTDKVTNCEGYQEADD